MRAKIRLYEPGDIDDVLEFRIRMYGPNSFLSSRGYMRWMFETPMGVAQRPSPQWLFISDGKVEGQQAGIRTALRVDGTDREALWATDFFVDPAYQLRGVGAVLSEVVTEETGITAGVEVSEAAKRAFLRAGWTDLGHVPLFVRPVHVGALARQRERHLPRPAAAVLSALGTLANTVQSAWGRVRRLRLKEVTTFDERSDAIWERCAVGHRVIGRRDAASLNWRYVDFPETGFYRCYYLMRGTAAVGYAVLGLKVGTLNEGRIVDYLCPAEFTTSLLNQCVRKLRLQGADAVYCMQQSPRHERSFATAGFVRRSTGWPLMVLAKGLDAETTATLGDPANWYVTYGDSNVDHPREGTTYAS